jgi:hypothetical protein
MTDFAAYEKVRARFRDATLVGGDSGLLSQDRIRSPYRIPNPFSIKTLK